MRRYSGQTLFSATDLVTFLGCTHASARDLEHLDTPGELPKQDDATAALLQQKGLEHEQAYLDSLRARGLAIEEIPTDLPLQDRSKRTLDALHRGVEVVYQGTLLQPPWHGYSDFLIKTDRPSKLGAFAYDVADTKLARTAKAKHIIQLCVYAELLEAIQGVEPGNLQVVLGDGGIATVRTTSVRHYFGVARRRFERFAGAPWPTAAEPCGHCTYCRWAESCETHWEEIDHLSLVANIARSQIDKLTAAGIDNLTKLATAPKASKIPNLTPETFARLRSQAALQKAKATTGKNHHELLPLETSRGFNRLPRPDAGDVFFDMEGDPLYPDGLEYLSRAIVALLAAGKRVGVTSLSHKAINNLLTAVEEAAALEKVRFKGVKKCSTEDQAFEGARQIVNTTKNDVACQSGFNLIAGTAWLFARVELDQALDYLFVDEAGQVSLANVVAMGVSAKNIILVGDQMQLSQPIQGVHPGGSGVSALDHLLGSAATVPEDRGVFLPVTRRMHPSLCQFVSDAFYEGRLTSDQRTEQQRLLADPTRDPEALAPNGLKFVPVDHRGCSQKCPAEAERLLATYEALRGRMWVNEEGARRRIGVEDILVVSPYNMQVDLLRSTLPDGARVGTVDKFQGQEAAVVLISMATSSGEDLPRNIEFLYSRNRLNVAVSRARCLAVIYASPRLLEVPCSTIDQMQLVHTLCWALAYSCDAG